VAFIGKLSPDAFGSEAFSSCSLISKSSSKRGRVLTRLGWCGRGRQDATFRYLKQKQSTAAKAFLFDFVMVVYLLLGR